MSSFLGVSQLHVAVHIFKGLKQYPHWGICIIFLTKVLIVLRDSSRMSRCCFLRCLAKIPNPPTDTPLLARSKCLENKKEILQANKREIDNVELLVIIHCLSIFQMPEKDL